MAKEELKWQNIDADDLPAAVKKSFDAMVEAEAAFKADLESLRDADRPRPEMMTNLLGIDPDPLKTQQHDQSDKTRIRY
jgi:hypothetical protein